MSDEDVPAPPLPNLYTPNEIILYGVRLNETTDYAQFAIEASSRFLRMSIIQGGATVPNSTMSIAVIYGYAFEGHCYRLDKGKITAFLPFKGPDAAVGCGFGPDGSGQSNYSMWRVSTKTMLVELTVNVDSAEEIVLQSNLPGNRPPNTYGNHMQLAHRSGRLTRNGG
ncbi:MAG TPA: hypothetical protein VLA00_10220 [Xanthobacteraceae bacterium]|nr:hypothetical protein [Xanthobacteraceae bacterium]